MAVELAACRPLESWIWHFDMLNDEKRNTAYLLAIRDWARRTRSTSTSRAAGAGNVATDRSVVLEIGTGSGILSSMVAREVEAAEGLLGTNQRAATRMPPPAEIVSVEVVDEIADCAAATFASQGGVPIQLVRCHSTALNVAAGAPPPTPPRTSLEQFLPAPAELVIGELLDTGLLGEGLISSMRDAAARLTTPDFASIPASAKIYAAPIQSEMVWRMGSLRPDHEEFKTGIKSPIEWTRCDGAAAAEGMHVRFTGGGATGGGATGGGTTGGGGIGVTPLAPTQPVFSFDFCHLETSGVHDVSFKIAQDGVIHGLVYWWVCNMSGSGAPHPILMATTPGSSPAPDHWRQNVCPLTRPVTVKVGQVLTVRAMHDEDMVWFEPFDEATSAASDFDAILVDSGSNLGSGSATAANTDAERQLLPPICRCGLHTTIPRSRLLALNDPGRRNAYRSALGSAYRHASERGDAESPRGSPPSTLVLGDGLFAPLLAAEAGFEVVVVALDARVAALGKRVVEANGLGERVKWVLGAEAISDPTDGSQTACDVAGALAGTGVATTVDLVAAEPYLPGVVADSEGGGVEGWGFDTALLLWSYLFHFAREFDSPAVSPVRAVVRGALYESTELFRLLSPVTYGGSDGGKEARGEWASDDEVAAEAAAVIAAAEAGTTTWPEALHGINMSSINTHRIDTTKVMVEGGPGLGCVNAYDVAADATALPLSQWSNTLTAATKPLELLSFDFTTSNGGPGAIPEQRATFEMIRQNKDSEGAEEDEESVGHGLGLGGSPTHAHVLVLWVDYQLDEHGSWLYGGPTIDSARQGVVRLEQPLDLRQRPMAGENAGADLGLGADGGGETSGEHAKLGMAHADGDGDVDVTRRPAKRRRGPGGGGGRDGGDVRVVAGTQLSSEGQLLLRLICT